MTDIHKYCDVPFISLSIILATFLYLAVCFLLGLESALFAASLFVLLPGFVFMTELA